MSAIVGQSLITAEQFEFLESEFPRDLVRGEIVPMSPPGAVHGHICGSIVFILESWARPLDIGVVTANDSAVVTARDPDSVRGCDVAFTRWEKLPGRKLPTGAFRMPPDLVVEVRSPSERWRDVMTKVGEYLEAGVCEVWVVDPEDHAVDVFRDDRKSVRLSKDEVLRSPDVLPDFACAVSEFFRHV